MRIVDEIPHELFKITVFSWNGKYIIKFELDKYEQTFKMDEKEVNLTIIRKMIDEAFLDDIFQGFLKMREAFGKAYQSVLKD
jgi:hypothetical protein